jgi:hypothetical protein
MSDGNGPQLGTLAFYEVMARMLNGDPVWEEKGKAITCTMLHAYGPPVNKRFFTSFDQGKVSEVAEVSPDDERSVDFVISGPPENWNALLKKEIKPTTAMTTGKLKVEGRQIYLLRNMAAFSYMLDLMTTVDGTPD